MVAKVRITPPRRQVDLVDRPDLYAVLENDVILLAAGAGYGKSQLLAGWIAGQQQEVAYGLCSRLGETASTLLELLFAALGISDQYNSGQAWQQQTDPLLEHLHMRGPVSLIVDDLHHIESSNSDAEQCRLLLSYLLDYRPPNCRLILSGRSLPNLADLDIRQMRGELTVLRGHQLALSQAHLEYLSTSQGDRLWSLTSGWPLAVAVLLRHPPDQWDAQKDSLSDRLLQMATADLSPAARHAVALLGLMGWASENELNDPAVWSELDELASQGLLVHRLEGKKFQLHPLFAEQYQNEAAPSLRQAAVDGLLAGGRVWEALELTRDPDTLARLLGGHGGEMLAEGRHHLLRRLLERATTNSLLSRLQGEVEWRLGDPGSALAAFSCSAQLAQRSGQALDEARAWSGAAGVYLDSVCPKEAGQYLKRAYRAIGPEFSQEKAKILERFAENAVNQGLARMAIRYRHLATLWDRESQEDLALTARMLLRSGRLTEARGGLEVALQHRLLEPDNGTPGSLEGHREPRLVLCYILSIQGQHERAQALAQEVLEQAAQLEDRLTEAVALCRLAHAKLVCAKADSLQDSGEVLTLYSQADALIHSLGVERLRAEMLMGTALYHTWKGNTPRAYEAARLGLSLAQKGGDSWMQTWLELVQAVAAHEGGHPVADDLLGSVRDSFRRCRDRFGYALTEVWMAQRGSHADPTRCRKALAEFPFLAQRHNLFGPKPESISQASAAVSSETEPKSLQIFCLGPLSLIRDGKAIPAKAFKRKKARELFAILLSAPDSFFHREDLAAQLWPEAEQKAGLRDFRVALHALSDALEPERAKNSTAFCIDRQEERYRLLSERVELDIHRFETLLGQDDLDLEQRERAFKLYRGSFCEDYPYLDSLAPTREKYDRLYLGLAENLAETYLTSGHEGQAAELAQRMLNRDATWEPAYRLLMRAQALQGHDHLLPRTFTLCLETLEVELGVEPSDETFALARELLGSQLATIL